MNNKVKQNYLKEFINKFKSSTKLKICLCILLIIIFSIIILLPEKVNNNNKTEDYDTFSNYINDLENKLSATLSQVKGAGQVLVVINVESGNETVLATEKTRKETSDGVIIEEKPITVNGKTVLIKEKLPNIIGVLVVTKGGDKIQVVSRIQQAVTSLLDINVNQIEILTMQ